VEGTFQQWVFAVAEPLLENLIAAEPVFPDVDRDRGPKDEPFR
jgi:hypothetical protein